MVHESRLSWLSAAQSGEIPVARCNHSAVSKDHLMFVFGGWQLQPTEKLFNTVYVLNVGMGNSPSNV